MHDATAAHFTGAIPDHYERALGPVIFADYAADGFLLGIELLAPCRADVLARVAEKEPEPIRQFLQSGVRKEMILA